LLSNKYGHSIHVWDLRAQDIQTMDFGENHQMALEIARCMIRPNPVVFAVSSLTQPICKVRFSLGGATTKVVWQSKKTTTIDPVPADPDDLPDLLKGFGAVPPPVTDIDLSLDDKYLYVACWGLGEMHQYDVSDPMNPVLAGKVELGGIVAHHKHPNGKEFAFGPQMVKISRDGQRVYWTNSLYSTWDDQFYPNGEGSQIVVARVGENGGFELEKYFYIDFPKGLRSRQIRLESGDCSTDGFCDPSVQMISDMTSMTALLGGVIFSGLYHGIIVGTFGVYSAYIGS
jgi:selenium-binding protein 1